MKLWHLCIAVLALGIVMALLRDPTSRFGLIIFVAALGEAVMAVATGLALVHTIVSAVAARDLFQVAGAVAGTTLVVLAGPTVMLAWLVAAAWLVSATVP